MVNSCIKILIVINVFNCSSINLLWYFIILQKFNGLILLYCQTYKSISRVSGAYDHKILKGKVLDFWKSYARDLEC